MKKVIITTVLILTLVNIVKSQYTRVPDYLDQLSERQTFVFTNGLIYMQMEQYENECCRDSVFVDIRDSGYMEYNGDSIQIFKEGLIKFEWTDNKMLIGWHEHKKPTYEGFKKWLKEKYE